MAQVVDSTNYEQFIETGKVDEFKPPEAKPEEIKSESVNEPNAAKAEDDDDSDLSEVVRQKIGKKHRAMKEAEEFAEREYHQRRAAEKRAEELERRLAQLEEKSRPATVEAKEPKQSDFSTVEEYIEALSNYKVEQRLEREHIEREQQRVKDETTRIQNAFAERLKKATQDIPDFEAVTSAVDTELPAHITQHILESDIGPLLGYHLAKHADELNRILKLSPIRAIAELGKLETALEKQPEKAAKPAVSKAPAPITPIEGKSAPVNVDLNREMTFAEYKALKAQQAATRKR